MVATYSQPGSTVHVTGLEPKSAFQVPSRSPGFNRRTAPPIQTGTPYQIPVIAKPQFEPIPCD